MTISSDDLRAVYTGDGSTSSFDFDFSIASASEISVSIYDVSADTVTTLTSGFSVSPNTAYPSLGGSVTYPSSGTDYLSSTEQIIIERTVDVVQDNSFAYLSSMVPKRVENALDEVVKQIIQASDLGERSLKLRGIDFYNSSISTLLPGPKAGYGFVWNEDEDGFIEVDIANILPYAEQAAASATAAAASATAAATSETNAATSETNAATSETNAAASETNAANSATQAGEYASQAEATANANADAYVDTTEYFYPTCVAYTDGYTYRCISTEGVTGEDPSTSSNWVRIDGISDDFFELDSGGDLMPTLNPTYSPQFELDSEDDIEPRIAS